MFEMLLLLLVVFWIFVRGKENIYYFQHKLLEKNMSNITLGFKGLRSILIKLKIMELRI